MPGKLDYLKDLAEHPASTALEAAARLKTSEATVAQACRRAQGQGLVKADDGQPKKYSVTDGGAAQLRVASENGASPSGIAADLSLQVRILQETVSDLADDVRTLFRFADKHLSAAQDGALVSADVLEPFLERLDGLETAVEELRVSGNGAGESAATDGAKPEVLELISLRSERKFLPKHSSRWEKVKALEAKLGPEVSAVVERFVDLQRELKTGGPILGWNSDRRVKEIENEIAPLREKLHLPAESETDEGAEEAAETEE